MGRSTWEVMGINGVGDGRRCGRHRGGLNVAVVDVQGADMALVDDLVFFIVWYYPTLSLLFSAVRRPSSWW
jgi:hypothetical protein